ncbi:C-C motif chemokine 25 isoform X2 [Peromyscus californicus insignis]|nr:C-C motif chemokine 25 isoform X2 [Peromyscus californicus insignis]
MSCCRRKQKRNQASIRCGPDERCVFPTSRSKLKTCVFLLQDLDQRSRNGSVSWITKKPTSTLVTTQETPENLEQTTCTQFSRLETASLLGSEVPLKTAAWVTNPGSNGIFSSTLGIIACRKFHFRQKGKVCMNPENKDVKRAMEILNAKNKPVDNPQKTTSGSHTERRKLNHMKSKVRNPSSTSMRNATLGRSRMVMMTRKINN